MVHVGGMAGALEGAHNVLQHEKHLSETHMRAGSTAGLAGRSSCTLSHLTGRQVNASNVAVARQIQERQAQPAAISAAVLAHVYRHVAGRVAVDLRG